MRGIYDIFLIQPKDLRSAEDRRMEPRLSERNVVGCVLPRVRGGGAYGRPP